MSGVGFWEKIRKSVGAGCGGEASAMMDPVVVVSLANNFSKLFSLVGNSLAAATVELAETIDHRTGGM